MKIEINVERKQFVVLSVLLLIAAISFTASVVVSVVGNMVVWHPLNEISVDESETSDSIEDEKDLTKDLTWLWVVIVIVVLFILIVVGYKKFWRGRI